MEAGVRSYHLQEAIECVIIMTKVIEKTKVIKMI